MLAYRILGIDPSKNNNNDSDVRHAYLKNLKKFPPEKFPEEYKIIRKAYEMVETEQKRINYFLFGGDNEFSFEDYAAIRYKVDTTIPSEKWGKLCTIYQKKILKTKSEN